LKLFLLLSALWCLGALARTSWRSYGLTLAYLAAVLPVTLGFRAESAWLRPWYPLLAGPLVLLRLAAGLEVLHRQTEGFYYWARLMGSAFLLAALFCCGFWVQSGGHDLLVAVVELRRLVQIFLGAVFLVVECFWLTQGGGFWRRRDHIALGFALLAWNHAGVSFLAGVVAWAPDAWERVSWWSWLVDGVAYCGMALSAYGLQPALIWLASPHFRPQLGRFLRGGLRSRAANHE